MPVLSLRRDLFLHAVHHVLDRLDDSLLVSGDLHVLRLDLNGHLWFHLHLGKYLLELFACIVSFLGQRFDYCISLLPSDRFIESHLGIYKPLQCRVVTLHVSY